MSEDATHDLGLLQGQRCAVVALDGDLDAVHTTADGAVGSSAAGSGDQHTSALCVDGDIFHGTDDVLSCVAAIISLDTIGQSFTLDGHILDGTNAGSGAGLQNNTADGLVCIALALHVDHQVFECGSIPNLDGSGIACMDNGTILDGGIALHAHAAISVAGSQGIAAQIQSDSLGDSQLISTVVNVSSHDDDIAILSYCQRCVQFSLGCNRILMYKLSLCINGLCANHAIFTQSVTGSSNIQDISRSIGLDVNVACGVAGEDNGLSCADVDISIAELITSSGNRLNILSIFVIAQTTSPVGEGRTGNSNGNITDICACSLAENDSAGIVLRAVTDEGTAVNNQIALCGDRTETTCKAGQSLAHVDGQVLNGCISLEAECSHVVTTIVNGVGELNGVAITVNGNGNSELGTSISCVPILGNSNIGVDVNGAAGGCSLESISQSNVANVANLSNEGNRSQNGLVVHNNSNVIVGISVVALLVVPQAVAGNVTGTETGSGGIGNSQGDAAGQAGVHFDSSLAVNSSGCKEGGVSDSDIVGNACTFVINQQGLTSGIEGTFVEGNLLCTIGPDVVCILAGLVEGTIVEGFGCAIQEDLTVDHTVVVGQIACMLQTLVVFVTVVEGNIVEGDVCTIHAVSTNVGELNAVNSTGNGDVLARELRCIDAGNHDTNLAAVLDICKCSIHGGVVLNHAVCISGRCADLVQVVGSVQLNVVGCHLLAVDLNSNHIGSHVDLGVACFPGNVPVLVIGAREGNIPADENIAVNDAVDIVQRCGSDNLVALVQLDDQALKCVAGGLAPDRGCRGVSRSNVALELTFNQNDLTLGVLTDSQGDRIIAGDGNSAGEAGCICIQQNIASLLAGSINGDRAGTGDLRSGQRTALHLNDAAFHHQRCGVGQLGAGQDQLACMVVALVITVGGSGGEQLGVGQSKDGVLISGHEGTDLRVSIDEVEGGGRQSFVEGDSGSIQNCVLEVDGVGAAIVAGLVAEGVIAADDNISVLDIQGAGAVPALALLCNQAMDHQGSLDISQVVACNQCVFQGTGDGDAVAIAQAVACSLGQSDRSAGFHGPCHGSGGAVVISQSAVVKQHIEAVVTTEGDITSNENIAADGGILHDRAVQEVDLLTLQSCDVQSNLALGIDDATVSQCAADSQGAAFNVDSAVSAHIYGGLVGVVDLNVCAVLDVQNSCLACDGTNIDTLGDIVAVICAVVGVNLADDEVCTVNNDLRGLANAVCIGVVAAGVILAGQVQSCGSEGCVVLHGDHTVAVDIGLPGCVQLGSVGNGDVTHGGDLHGVDHGVTGNVDRAVVVGLHDAVAACIMDNGVDHVDGCILTCIQLGDQDLSVLDGDGSILEGDHGQLVLGCLAGDGEADCLVEVDFGLALIAGDVLDHGDGLAILNSVQRISKRCVVNAVDTCNHVDQMDLVVLQNSAHQVIVRSLDGLSTLDRGNLEVLNLACGLVGSINRDGALAQDLGCNELTGITQIDVGVGDVANGCLCAVDQNQLANALAVHCMASSVDLQGQLGSIDGDGTVVAAVLTELDHGASQNRTVLQGHLAAVTQIGTQSHHRVVDDNGGVGNCVGQLGGSGQNGILHIQRNSGVLAAGGLREGQLISELSDGIGEVQGELAVCCGVLGGGVADHHIGIGHIHGGVIAAGDGHTAGNDQRGLNSCLISGLCILDGAGDIEGVAVAQGHTAGAGDLQACALTDGDDIVGTSAEAGNLGVTCEGQVAASNDGAVDLLAITVQGNASGQNQISGQGDVVHQDDGVASLGSCSSLFQGVVLIGTDGNRRVVAVDGVLIQGLVLDGNGDLGSSSGGQLIVLLILRGTDCHPDAISVGGGHGVGAGNGDGAVHRSLTDNDGDKCLNSVVLDDSIVVVLSIQTDAVAVDVDVTALDGDALDSAQCQTALGVGNGDFLNGQVHTGSVLQERVQTSTGTFGDNCAVSALQTNRNRLSLAIAGEGAALNGQAGIVVGFNRRDEINLCIRLEVDVLDGDSSVIVGIGQSLDGDSTVHGLVVAIDGVGQANLLGQGNVLGNITNQNDGLAICNCIDSSLQGLVLSIADQSNLLNQNDALVGALVVHVGSRVQQLNSTGEAGSVAADQNVAALLASHIDGDLTSAGDLACLQLAVAGQIDGGVRINGHGTGIITAGNGQHGIVDIDGDIGEGEPCASLKPGVVQVQGIAVAASAGIACLELGCGLVAGAVDGNGAVAVGHVELAVAVAQLNRTGLRNSDGAIAGPLLQGQRLHDAVDDHVLAIGIEAVGHDIQALDGDILVNGQGCAITLDTNCETAAGQIDLLGSANGQVAGNVVVA